MDYTVKQGDHLSQIAFRHGFRDYRTVWNDPANADLKARRGNPNVLMPGDTLVIPDKKQRTEFAPTDQRHVFVTPAPTLRLRVRLRNVNGEPLANTDCELIVDGQKKMLKTDGDGRIDQPLPVLARAGSVILAGEEYRLRIGELDPVEEESGQRARLANLGYYFGSGADVDQEQLRIAVEEFQCDHGLAVDGVCGPQTRKKLREVHGC